MERPGDPRHPHLSPGLRAEQHRSAGPHKPSGLCPAHRNLHRPARSNALHGGKRHAPHVFLIGDSHAMAFSPALAQVRELEHAEVTLLAHTGCLFPNTPYGHSQSVCSRFLDLAEPELLQFTRPGDVVVITGYLLSHLGDSSQLQDTRDDILGSDGRPVPTGEQKLLLYRQGLARFAEKAAARGVAVVLVGATPRNPEIRNCVPDWFNLQPKQDCERTVKAELNHAIELNRRLRQVLPARVQLFDPIPALCGKGCDNEAVIELLRDTDHLSTTGARRLGASLVTFLRQVRLPSSS